MYVVYLEKVCELPASVSSGWRLVVGGERGLTLVPSAGLCTTVVWASWGEVGDTLPCREGTILVGGWAGGLPWEDAEEFQLIP